MTAQKKELEVKKKISLENRSKSERAREIPPVIDTCYIHNQLMAGFFFQVFNFSSIKRNEQKNIMQIYASWSQAVKVKSQYEWFIRNH